MKTKTLIASLAAGVVATTGMAVAPMMIVDDFPDYNPPDRITVQWADYWAGDSGLVPSPTPTDRPTHFLQYPYRAVFLGGFKDNTVTQGHVAVWTIVFSRKPISDHFDFEYIAPRGSRTKDYGVIWAKAKDRADFSFSEMGTDEKDIAVYQITAGGISAGSMPVIVRNSNLHFYYPSVESQYGFRFDFFWICESNLNIEGLLNLTDVPYGYILTCLDGHGRPGGSESGSSSSSGGSSGGGGSSSGSESGGSSGGGSRPGPGEFPDPPGGDDNSWDEWESSSGGGSNPDEYPWEDEDKDPDLPWQPEIPEYPGGQEDDDGEKGDGWELPEYDPPGLPWDSDDLNIPPWPGGEFPSLPAPDFELPDVPSMPDTTPPDFNYEPDSSGGWPPPFPGTN